MLAFVEGSMERQFINANFKYVRVVPIQNGISWSVDQLAFQITTAYKAFGCDDEVVIWLDRESRGISAESLRLELLTAMDHAGSTQDKTHILINDRMSENIILADESVIKIELDQNYSYVHEGQNGKHILKELFKRKGINYKERKEGVLFLKKIRLSRSAISSPCVASFLSTFKIQCWWI